MISKFIDNLWRPRRDRHHRRFNKTTAPLAATEKLEDRTLLSGQDLIAFGQALSAANVTLYGAAWDADTAAQKSLLGDGASYVNFVDITNNDRTLNGNAADVNISDVQNLRPIWKLNDGTLIEGSSIQSLQDLADATGIAITDSEGPYLKEIPTQNLLANTGLHVALDGFDPEGGPLTYTVTSSNPDVSARILTGNRSLRINVAGYGEMIYELFEGRASRATDQIIQLAQDGFYDGVTFHRIINNALIQGGDPTGTGTGGSTYPSFDDQFNPELQHVQSGLLSMAKSFDDTNNSQFFITDRPLRRLDYQHTIFGFLTEGDDVRNAINDVKVVNTDEPLFNITMESVSVFNDTENATLFLNAPEGYSGSSTITVTVTDQYGNQQQRQFQVNVAPDTIDPPYQDPVTHNIVFDESDANPYLADIPLLQVRPGESIQYQLQAIDVDATAPNNSQPVYMNQDLLSQYGLAIPAEAPAGLVNTIDLNNQGILTISPDASLAPGIYQLTVAVGFQTSAIDYQVVSVAVTDPPVANDDFVALQGNTPDAFDIFANDTDSDGEIDKQSVEFVSQPAHGTVSLVEVMNGGDVDYKVKFTPDGSGYMGIDSFTYRVKDNLGVYSNVATVEFSMAPEGVILVTNRFDADPENRVTLRNAIDLANSTPGADIIMFDPALFNDSARELALRSEIDITDSVTIIAPTSESGDPLLSIKAKAGYRHFLIDNGLSSSVLVSLQNLKLTGSQFSDNGAAIFNAENLVIRNSVLTGNQTTAGLGGAIYNTGALEIYNSLIQSNSSQNTSGGAITSQSGSVLLNGTTLLQNTAEGSGAGIYANDSTITLVNSNLSSNTAYNGSGGGIYLNGGTLNITGSTLYDNRTGAATDGGGVYTTEADVTIVDSTFDQNRSTGSGGGLSQNLGSLTVRGSTFSGNSALFGNGGGISTGALTNLIVNSTLSGNSSDYDGGGIYFSDPVGFVNGIISNSTIANNNSSQYGGGLHAEHNTITLYNTLIADNSASYSGTDVLGTVNGNYSLIEATDGLLIEGTNFITGQDPGLLPLADNGGPTKTQALDTSSIAIDAGNPAFDPATFDPELDLDQRGSARVSDGNNDTVSQVDIGAYEAVSVLGSANLTVKYKATNTGGTGQVSSLPVNVDFLDEWNPVVVEIWVSITNSPVNGVASASVDFSFDATYLTADSIEYGDGFTYNQSGSIDNNNGTITGLGAASSQPAYGAESLVLLARVTLSVKPVDLNADGHYIQPVGNLNFQIANSSITSTVGNTSITEGAAVNLALVPALYDLNDSGKIDYKDLIQFVSAYNKTTGTGTAGADLTWAADFDRSGKVDFRDLTLLAANYNKAQGGSNFLIYPSNFDEVWQQNNLITSLVNPPSPDSTSQPLTSEAVQPVLEAAKQQVAAGSDSVTADQFSDVKIEIVELPANQLARADSTTNTIYLDVNAAGWGWFVDSTPDSSSEFDATQDPRVFTASLLSPAGGQIDLLTVLLHELNHLLGHEHVSDASLMDPVLEPGERKLAESDEMGATDEFFGSYLDPEFGGIN